MSFPLYWRPLPKVVEQPESGYQLKWAIAKRFGEHDGSCREGPFVFDQGQIQWLEGVRDGGGKEIAGEARRLLSSVVANPQGVDVWIGDPEDV